MYAAGVNFADILARLGLYPDAPKPPVVVGYEVSGAVDAVGAGRGQIVMITSDGKFVREVVKQENTPIRWSAIGIADA